MEDNLDKIVYIVIAIVISIVSSIARANKKKQAASRRTEEKESPDPRPVFFPGYDDEPELEDDYPVTSRKQYPDEEIRPVVSEASKMKTKTDDVKIVSRVEAVGEEKENAGDEEPSEILQDFDISKAVVYSEILARKY